MRIWRRVKPAKADAVMNVDADATPVAGLGNGTAALAGEDGGARESGDGEDSGWGWFEGGLAGGTLPPVLPEAENAGVIGVSRQERDLAWQRVLGASAGHDAAVVCAELRAMTLERALGPAASPQAIWMREGQRALVLQMLRRARGG
ncbi:hypothetical protein [Thalassospira mesophila]|uniref:Bbp19-like phage domain-containing protein n=1 Tax=Thalassospira mesophila TaxID=1293891 RepID=A0A1Y2L2T2_9PROT|nr:hypothetical protein [Thalassospira mesophila]OSQ39790.1 hypothetical protein TMES_07585 [Thalassospira mesophila]